MLHQALTQYFSFSEFRQGQEEIVQSIIDGHDTVALMPTGGGKSLCYQLPATIFPGITLVISPLIALMKNQVDSLVARGISATFLNSTLDAAESLQRKHQIELGACKLVYVSPERLSNPEFCKWLAGQTISFIAIDEAHCISSWGHDFRPEYQQIAQYLKRLGQRPVVAAFTATATQLVVEDICKKLDLKDTAVFVRGFDRPNIRLFVREKLAVADRKKEALRLINSMRGAGIVYTLTIKEAQEVATFLQDHQVRAVAYHAKLDSLERTQIQDAFMDNQYQVVVATVAFGMGIDKADIRYVIHVGMPPNLERYYQEAGRAGRDGELAYCVLLHNGRDKSTQHFFIQQSQQQMREAGKTYEEIHELVDLKYRQLDSILEYVGTTGCRRKVLLEYFHDPAADALTNCGNCDRCLNFSWDKSAVKSGRKPRGAWVKNKDELSGTVMETVKLYQQDKTPEQISKIRSLGLSTIISHLSAWLVTGGDFKYQSLVNAQQEKMIRAAAVQHGGEKLGPLKQAVPASISYDQIRLVLAVMEREKAIS